MAVCVPMLAVPGSGLAETGYENFHNDRFGFSISYPETFKVELPENGDGARFIVPNAPNVDIRAAGSLNVNEDSADVLFQQAAHAVQRERGVVTYATRTQNGYVLSGVIGNQVYYERVILASQDGTSVSSGGSDYILTLTLRFPTVEKPRFDPVLRTMSQTFRPGRGSD